MGKDRRDRLCPAVLSVPRARVLSSVSAPPLHHLLHFGGKQTQPPCQRVGEPGLCQVQSYYELHLQFLLGSQYFNQCPMVPHPGCLNVFPNPNLFHLLLQGVQGVSPGQQLLQAPQLPLLLLTVLLLLLPLLLQGSDLGFVAADGVWRGGKGRGDGGSGMLALPLGDKWGSLSSRTESDMNADIRSPHSDGEGSCGNSYNAAGPKGPFLGLLGPRRRKSSLCLPGHEDAARQWR